MYSFLIDSNSENKKTKSASRNVVEEITYDEYKDVLLNNKCLRKSMNRIQSKDHKIGAYEIKKVSLSCFDDKIYMQNKWCDGLVRGYYNSL